MSRYVLWPCLAAAAAAGLAAQEPKTAANPLVATQEGTLPVILSAPHGGTKAIPDVPPRKGEGLEKGAKGFRDGRDGETEELAYAAAAAIEAKTGKKPYYVVARFARKYVDANRPPEIAYEDPKAKVVYDSYRGTIADYCRAVKKTHGRGLVLDFHGQGSAADTIFRGTSNGKAVTLLVQRYGEKAHLGPQSLFGLLTAQGCKVFPAVGETVPERAGYTGGHITTTYGGEAYGMDAMQLEFGGDYRAKDKIKDTAAKVAAAVAEYVKLYLTDEK